MASDDDKYDIISHNYHVLSAPPPFILIEALK